MLMMVYSYLLGLMNKEEGQGMVEYALIIALVVIVVIGVLVLLGDELIAIFNNIITGLQT